MLDDASTPTAKMLDPKTHVLICFLSCSESPSLLPMSQRICGPIMLSCLCSSVVPYCIYNSLLFILTCALNRMNRTTRLRVRIACVIWGDNCITCTCVEYYKYNCPMFFTEMTLDSSTLIIISYYIWFSLVLFWEEAQNVQTHEHVTANTIITNDNLKRGIEEEAVANWPKREFPVNTYNFWQRLMIFNHSRLVDESTDTIVPL